MGSSQIFMLIAMAAYLFLMMGVGFKFSEKNETMGDFYLGGRKLGPFVTAMSAEASDMSSWLLMGLPGVAYLSGVADAGWTAIGLAVGTYLNWLIVAKRLRRYSEKNNSITIPQFFANRYGDKQRVLTLISAIWIIVFFVPYTASGFAACGKLFASLFGIEYHVAMIMSAVVIILYTTLGGFLAASTTDFMQSIVMSIALIVILIFGTVQAGGIGAVADNARSLAGYLSFFQMHDPATGTATAYSALTIASTMAWGLGYFGMPHILLRFMAIEDENKLALSRRVATIWVVISMAAAVIIGIVGLGMTVNGKVPLLEGSQSETIIVEISQLLARYGAVPALIAGVVLSGILASTMSTSDSQLLAASSSVSNDILVGFFKMESDERKLLFISRVSLIVIAIIGIFLAWDSNSSVFQIVSFAWAGFGASFGPVMLLALFWKRSNKYGAICGMLVGGIMIFVWKFAIRPMGGILNIYELLPAFIIAIIVNVIVSLVTPAPETAIVKEFEEV
ncbi:MAG: sodium/proline symporter [Lachnospiraceae bacterium]|nr:sodium/proline symporter [Lachnospiraceae bacterium]